MLQKLKTLWAKPVPSAVEDNKFDHIMGMANSIAQKSPLGLRELVRALLLPLQAEHMVAVVERVQHAAPAEIRYWDFFFRIENQSDYYLRNKPREVLTLGRDVLLPTVWKRSSYFNALASIGTGKSLGPWCQDEDNRTISLLLPWRIGFVSGGNHSITAGILMSEGEVVATEVFDMTPLLQRVRCDGKTYREISTDRVLGVVTDPRRAAVFEIGRMMLGCRLPVN
ncbi:DUF6710 family protein [Polaromonas sp. JS666]|uniref:DUF6710 family protein n=1 Tax=Polaromonas sp. (strain JS666 / ATCC BAA-500) TaxID=296591 RepID=UPI0000536E40|nr:DUF6710 family protein [Polaromonas sp. JS666]ABE47277.1 hypothetical protein Bpro_5423 [Polaromonas sp. JS666]